MTAVSVLDLFLRRYRRVFWIVVAYYAVLVGLTFLPKGTLPELLPGMLLPPAFLGLLVTLAAFSNPEADLAGEGSGFPAFALRLPIQTLNLALWPILGVAVWGAFCWFVLARLYMLPFGMSAPIWSPCAVVAALGTTLQAVLWMPVRNGALRVIPAVLAPVLLIGGAFWMTYEGMASEKVALIYLAIAFVSGIFGGIAVARARTSGVSRRPARERTFRDRARKFLPFASPLAAHFWVEWRKQGRILPILTTAFMALLSIPLLWRAEYLFERGDLGGYLKINPWVTSWMPFIPAIPLLIATVLGMGAARSYLRSPEGSYHLFFATRPMSSVHMLRAKYLSISAGVLLSWVIVVGFAFAWLLVRAEDKTHQDYTVVFLFQRTAPIFWLKLGGIVLALMLWTWRNQMVGAFADYVPFPAIRGIYALIVSLIGGAVYFTLMARGRELGEPGAATGVAIFLGIVLILKLIFAGIAASRLLKVEPGSARYLARSFALWTVAAIVLGFAGNHFGQVALDTGFPPGLFSKPSPALATLILIPLTRPILARLALEVGRHRG